MGKYRYVTGEILSHDRYREEKWDPGLNKKVEKCLDTVRVEYMVDKMIYTHSFSGPDIHGEVGDKFEMMYLSDDPETVKPAPHAKRNRRLKAGLALCLVCVIGLLAYRALFGPPSIIHVPDGFTEAKEYLNKIGLQDSTDYCIYRYASADAVAYEGSYGVMTEEDAEAVQGYFENFKECPGSEKGLAKTPFDETCINAGDYCLIDTREGEIDGDYTYGEYDSYSVWYFDVETCTLYYIHFNV